MVSSRSGVILFLLYGDPVWVECVDYDVNESNDCGESERGVVEYVCGEEVVLPVQATVAEEVESQRQHAHQHLN